MGKIMRYDGNTVYTYDSLGSYISGIAIDAQGNKWITTLTQLIKFDNLNWTVYDVGNMRIQAITIDYKGNKWIATRSNGIFKFDDSTWTNYSWQNSLWPDLYYNYVNTIIKDESGNILARTNWGVVKFDSVESTILGIEVLSTGVGDIVIDDLDNKWITFAGAGLLKISNSLSKWTVYNPSNSGLPDYFTTKIALDQQGNVWIGTIYKGLGKV